MTSQKAMRLAREGIVRSTRWATMRESGRDHRQDWRKICGELAPDPAEQMVLATALTKFAEHLRQVPAIAKDLGASPEILWFIVASVVREQIDQRLDTQIEGLRSALGLSEDGSVRLDAQLNGPPFDRPGSGWYWQVTSQNLSLSSRSLQTDRLERRRCPDWRDLGTSRPRPSEAEDAHGKALYVRTLQAQVGDQSVQITVSAPQSALTDPALRSLMWLLPAMLLLGVSLLIGTYFQVRFGLKPLIRLTTDIGAVSSGNKASLPDAGVDELKPVSIEINRLVALNTRRLEDTRIHFANMAHGLKTPVASLTIGLNEKNDPDGGLRDLVHRIDRRIRHHLADARKAAVAELTENMPPAPKRSYAVSSRGFS